MYVYLQMDQPPERRRSSRKKKQPIDPYKPYLIKRWNEGCDRRNSCMARSKSTSWMGGSHRQRNKRWPNCVALRKDDEKITMR